MIQSAFGVCFIISVTLLTLWAIVKAWPMLNRSTLASRYMQFLSGSQDLGFHERQGELKVRMAAARLRRRVSEECARLPGNYLQIKTRIMKEEAMRLASTDKAAGRAFLIWAEQAGQAEILYPSALDAVTMRDRDYARKISTGCRRVDQDFLAAISTQK